MKKEISNLLLYVFQDKSFLIKVGLSPLESDVFYHLLLGESMKDIAKKFDMSIRSIKRIKIRCFHSLPKLIKAKVGFFEVSNLEKINANLTEIDLILRQYSNFSTIKDSKKVKELNLSTRTISGLSSFGIRTISDLMNVSYDELIQIRNIGEESINEIKIELSRLNIALKE